MIIAVTQSLKGNSLRQICLSINYKDRQHLDKIAEILGFSFGIVSERICTIFKHITVRKPGEKGIYNWFP